MGKKSSMYYNYPAELLKHALFYLVLTLSLKDRSYCLFSYTWGKRSCSEILSNMPSITQHVNDRTKVRTRACFIQSNHVYQVLLINYRKEKFSEQLYNIYFKPSRQSGEQVICRSLSMSRSDSHHQALGNISK